MTLRLRSALLLAGALFATGCVHTGFTRSSPLAAPPREPNCYLDLILDGTPPYAYVVIGRVSTDSTSPGLWALGESEDVAMERMKDEACANGAHGLMRADTGSMGVWTRDGYSKSTRGGAVAFVYVDPQGHPLPPPTGPRVVIQPGSVQNGAYAPQPPVQQQPPQPPPPPQ